MRQAKHIPIQMDRTRDGYIATVTMTGDSLRGFGETAEVAEVRVIGLLAGAIKRRSIQQSRREESTSLN